MICFFRMLFITVILGAGLVCSIAGAAEEGEKMSAGRVYGFGESSGNWSMQGVVTHLPSADLRGTAGDAGITDYRMKLDRDFRLDNALTLTLGGGYGLKHIDSSPVSSLPQDLHGLFVETGLKYRINDRSFASVRLFPGFYSDFKELGSDDLRMPVLALGGYRFDNGVSLIGGFLYRFGYHAGQYIPALGISYQPNEFWRLDLIAPRPGVTYLASRQVQLFLAGDFASDEYELKDRTIGAKVLKYSDYKAMGGVSYLPLPFVKLTTAAGYAFERRFAFFDGNRPDSRLEDVPFFRVSLDVGW